jgi:adenylate cyclase
VPEKLDFEAEGLLAGTEGPAREARIRLLEYLLEDGADPEDIRREAAADRLALMPADSVFGINRNRYTAQDIAGKSGIEVEDFLRLIAALGFPKPAPDQRAFDEADLGAAYRYVRLEAAGIPGDQLIDASRRVGSAAARIAGAHREVISGGLIDPDADEFEMAIALREAAERLLPLAEEAVAYALRSHFVDQMRNEIVVTTDSGRFGRSAATEVSVCFADLVGFTRLGERSEIERIGTVAKLLESVAIEVTNPDVRLVKLIGDAAMLVSEDGAALFDAALRFIEVGHEAGEDLPALRVGVARGEAIPQGGDWFGPAVNLASRITEAARPDSVLADAAAVDAAGDGFAYSKAGQHRFKGLKSPVRLFRVRRPG